MKRRSTSRSILLGAFVLLVLVGLIWANLFYVDLNPTQGSFLPRWLGTRLFLVKGQSPYSQETTDAIEQAQQAGGGAVSPGSSYFLYPFFSFLVYTPFSLTGNQISARIAWMTFLELALLAGLAISLNLSRWRAPGWAIVLLVLFTISFYYSVRPIMDGDISILITLLIVFALAAVRAEQDPLAGFLLALSMVKPGPVFLFALFLLVWGGSQRRWILVWSFLGSLALIVAATSLLIPDWVVQNIRQLIAYFRLPITNTPGALTAYWLPGIGKQFGWLLTILGVTALGIEWYQARGQSFRWFLWTACLTLSFTPLIGLPTSINNLILLLPALILALATWDGFWGKTGKALWISSLVILFAGGWWLFIFPAQRGMLPEQNPWLFFFFPVYTLVALYWVRIWAIRPPRLPLTEMNSQMD